MTTATATPPAPRTFFRFWLPVCIVAGAALALVALWAWPADALERGVRGISSVMVSVLSLLLLSAWLLFFSPLRWWRGLAIIVVGVLVLVGAVREVKLTGDWVPLFVFRWDGSPQQGQAWGMPGLSVPPGAGAPANPTDFPEFRG